MELYNQDLLKKLVEAYDKVPPIKSWAFDNQPDPDLIYKSGVNSQEKRFDAVSHVIDYKLDSPRVISQHSSKSVGLPVAAFNFNFHTNVKGFALVRDNFYDIKFCVVSNVPVRIPYELVHKYMSQDDYDKEKERSYNYCKGHKNFDECDYATDKWFDKWCSDYLIREEGKIWRAFSVHSVYCEGINKIDFLPKELYKPYTANSNLFTISLNRYSKLCTVFDLFADSLHKGQSQWATEYPSED